MTYAILGSSKGLSAKQFHALAEALRLLPLATVIRTLDEHGAAEMSHYIARAIHHDARISSGVGVLIESCAVLIALPSGPEDSRSPTWQGVRLARAAGRRIRVIAPDGAITDGVVSGIGS